MVRFLVRYHCVKLLKGKDVLFAVRVSAVNVHLPSPGCSSVMFECLLMFSHTSF